MGKAVQKYLLIHDNFNFRDFIFLQPEPSFNVSTIQEAIFESRRQKIIEVCKKYKMNTGKPSSEIFDTILCFSKYQVSIPIYNVLQIFTQVYFLAENGFFLCFQFCYCPNSKTGTTTWMHHFMVVFKEILYSFSLYNS